MTVHWENAREGRFRPDGVVGTPLHARTAASSATPWVFAWDLHHVVDVYDDFHAELRAVRETAAMGDMSPLSKCMLTGPDAGRLLSHLIPRQTDDLGVGSVWYTPLCSHEGKVVCDGLLFRVDDQCYRFTGAPVLEWIRQNADGFDVEISDETYDYAILMVQGPRSRDVVEAATGKDWSGLDFSRRTTAVVGGVEIELDRQGFTGELGYEIMMPAGSGPEVWGRFAFEGGVRGAAIRG